MKCKQVRELAGPYLYGDLTPEEMKQVRLHTQECECCRNEIRTQGAVLSAIPADGPELTDEDRQRIAWTVKGAIRASEQERQTSRFRFPLAYALAGAVVITMIAIQVVGTMRHQPRISEANVIITEVTKPKPKNNSHVDKPEFPKPETDTQANASDTPVYKEHRHRRAHFAQGLNVLRSVAPMATSRKRGKPAVVKPEPPANEATTPENPKVRVDNGDVKLPAPTSSNDAQTAPPERPAPPAGNGMENSENTPTDQQ